MPTLAGKIIKTWRLYMIKSKNNKGFTLVELIVVIVILAILAAILVPALLGYIDRSKDQKFIYNAETVYKAAQATASEYYAHPVAINPNQNDGKMTDTNGYWIPLTNDRGGLSVYGQKFPYMKSCYALISGSEMPKFYAVAVIDKSKPGMVKYVTYYDVESQKVAYWDYNSNSWTVESNIPKPSNSNWKYVLTSAGKSSENFSSYYK